MNFKALCNLIIVQYYSWGDDEEKIKRLCPFKCQKKCGKRLMQVEKLKGSDEEESSLLKKNYFVKT